MAAWDLECVPGASHDLARFGWMWMMVGDPPRDRRTDDAAIRVCVDARALSTGHAQRGIGTYVATLMASLDALVPVASAASPANGEPVDGIQLRYLTADGDVSVLRQSPWDVYHATTLEGIILSPSYRTVATLHDLIPLRLPDWARRARHPVAALAYQRQLRLLRRVDHIIAVSAATKRDAVALLGIASERISVVLPALDPARAYVPTADQLAAARRDLGLQIPYFLAVASSEPHKNLARVIEAFARFSAESGHRAGYRLYLVGTWMGREERRLGRLIERLGLREAVRRLPWVPAEQMAALYHGATALVFPSLLEGFGLPVVEAMACETAVITSNRSSLPEVAGDAALAVDPEDVEGIAAALARVADDPDLRADLIARGRERSQQFRPERAAREMVAVYRRVASGHRTAQDRPPD
jgi:glycosyltransferase involved in cell wall biosynthesis